MPKKKPVTVFSWLPVVEAGVPEHESRCTVLRDQWWVMDKDQKHVLIYHGTDGAQMMPQRHNSEKLALKKVQTLKSQHHSANIPGGSETLKVGQVLWVFVPHTCHAYSDW